MEVVLLGTGAADGWPNPFCGCASCLTMLRRGESRAQTAALVDDVLLLDCGPEVPRAAIAAGRSLAGVRHLLLTHAHPDHAGPLALLMRSWAGCPEPLDVVGPPEALDLCRAWVGPGDPIRWLPVAPGDRLRVGGYDVRALPAAHRVIRDGDSVLYDVTGPDGRRLLWATDTGPLPDSTLAAVRDARFDAVFLEETFGDKTDHGTDHLDLSTFPRAVVALREVGAVVDGTDVIAVHLGHHNPVDLPERVRPWGASVLDDGSVVSLGVARPRNPGPLRTLVTGGARSGKSTHAERLLAVETGVTYLASGGVRPDDPEWMARVRAHRARRPASWRTIETDDVAAVLASADGPVLWDCVGTWLAARLDARGAWTDESGVAGVRSDIDALLAAWRSVRLPVVAVTNEVGSGVVPDTLSGRLFRDELGRLNAMLAAESESVVLMVAGRPVSLP